MPFFNFRRTGSSSAAKAATATQPESVEVIRKRAKHRLIGASVLVLAGVVGFPLLFDTQPRPIAIDIPIEIPGKNTVKPLVLPARPASAAIAASAPAAVAAETPAKPAAVAPPASDKVAATSSLNAKEEIITDKKPAAPAAPPEAAIKKEAKPVPKAEAKAEVKPAPVATVDDGARARALLNGQTAGPATAPAASASAEGRMVVQVGAFADAAKAREVRLKLEKAGLKTYTQVAETKDGKRIRVRVGPFATKAEADKAASKIKSLDLPAAILTL